MRLAMMWSDSLAIQYAPLAPASRIQATTGLSICSTARVISSLATALPPGLLISRSTAAIDGSSSACSSQRVIWVLLAVWVERSPVGDSMVITPVTGMTATELLLVGRMLMSPAPMSASEMSAAAAMSITWSAFIVVLARVFL